MNISYEKSFIVVSISVVVTLFFVAMFTITKSFGYNSINEKSNWDVYYSEAMLTDGSVGNVDVSTDTINLNCELDKFGEEFSFITSINNDGTYDAYLSDIKMTDLSEIEVGKSSDTGNTYTLKDYVSFKVTYYANNLANKVIVDNVLREDDLLKVNTNNKIFVSVKFRDEKSLTEDKLKVLEEYGKSFDLDLSINTIFQQVK